MTAAGAWPSPISADAAARGGPFRLGDLRAFADGIYWTESRPAEAGRCVIVRHRHGGIEDALPSPWSARTSVHEYGGAAFTVHDGTVYFSNASDGLICRFREGDLTPAPLSSEPGLRFADFVVDIRHRRLISVVEDHRDPAHVENYLGAIPLDGGALQSLVRGADFYAAPRLCPDGERLAWLSWDIPAMPWDSSLLSVAQIEEGGRIGPARVVAGETGEESLLAPQWSPEGRLHFVSDRSGWWNLHRLDADGRVECVAVMEADCGLPAWSFGLQSYAFIKDGGVVIAAHAEDGWGLFVVDAAGRVRRLPLPFTDIGDHVWALGDSIVTFAGGPAIGPSVIRVDPATGSHQVLRTSMDVEVDPGYLSVGESISFPTDGVRARAILYLPRNSSARPGHEKPPLVVRAHGGPTSQARTTLDLTVQYFTSRGFAFCDVDYRGSSGYGRAYRLALHRQCGVVDVADCLAAARHLADNGIVDRDRMFIRGGSAGGHIALLAVCGHDVFAAASSHYGVADALELVADTHKFESHYYDVLIGPVDEARDLYRERSPLCRVAEIAVPVLLFQGLDDAIVPPSQTEAMLRALRGCEIPTGYIGFEGEAHGFRRAETLIRVLEAELWFFQRVMGMTAARPDAGLELSRLS